MKLMFNILITLALFFLFFPINNTIFSQHKSYAKDLSLNLNLLPIRPSLNNLKKELDLKTYIDKTFDFHLKDFFISKFIEDEKEKSKVLYEEYFNLSSDLLLLKLLQAFSDLNFSIKYFDREYLVLYVYFSHHRKIFVNIIPEYDKSKLVIISNDLKLINDLLTLKAFLLKKD